MIAAYFRKANAGSQLNFCNAKFIFCPPWMAKAIPGQSSCNPAVLAQVIKDAHGFFGAFLEAEETQTVRNSTFFYRLSSNFSGQPQTAVSQLGDGL